MTNPIHPTDDDARALAQSLLIDARHAALGVIDGATCHTRCNRMAKQCTTSFGVRSLHAHESS